MLMRGSNLSYGHGRKSAPGGITLAIFFCVLSAVDMVWTYVVAPFLGFLRWAGL